MADQALGVEPATLPSAWQGRRRLLQAARRELHLPHRAAGRVRDVPHAGPRGAAGQALSAARAW
eukprot:11057020-Alexandrium_andersonii.AAC.1